MRATSIVLLGASSACAPQAPPRARGPVEGATSLDSPSGPSCVSIVAWNDMHGRLAAEDVQIDTGRIPAGGVVAIADQVAQIRATGDAVVVLDAGDQFAGTLESTLSEGAGIVEAYKAIGVDAAAIGNHEFDFGPVGFGKVTAGSGVGDAAGAEGPRGALLARMASATYPFLSANITLKGKGGKRPGWPNFAPSARVDRGGFRVGVVGYTTQDTPGTTLRPNIEDLELSAGAVESVAREVHALRAAGYGPIVLLAHASLEGDLSQQLDDPADPQGARRTGEVAQLLAGVGDDLPDLVVAGHRHAWLLGRVRGVPIVSSDQHGVGLARARYCRPSVASAGEPSRASGAPPKLQSIERRVALATTPPLTELGAKVAAAVAPWREQAHRQAEEIVATVARTCPTRGPTGSALGEQMARAVAAHAPDAAPPPAGVPVVAIINSGGIRAPVAAGPVRFGALFATFPFENSVGVCSTTREGLRRVIRNLAGKPSAGERFPFGIAGAHVTFKRREGGGLELTRIDIGGSLSTGTSTTTGGAKGAAGGDAPVWLALPDFVLWGGEGALEGVSCKSVSHSATRMRDAWREVLARDGACDGTPKNVTIE